MEQHGISFSIIIPLYNKEQYIFDTIDSVLKQTYNNYEIIVVNDSSTDNSLSVVQSFGSRKLKVYTRPNGGVSKTRNYGITKAKNDYICFLDADDVWDNCYLENLVSIIMRFPKSGFITGAYYYCNNEINNISYIVSLKNKPTTFSSAIDFFKESSLNKRIIALTSCVCVKRDLLESMNEYFKEGIRIGEDADMWFRVALKTSVVYYNTPYLYYRGNTDNSLGNSYITSLKYTFPYWQWYHLKSSNKYKNYVTTLMIYTTAKHFYINNKFSQSISILSKCKGLFLMHNRILLHLKCIFSLLFNN